MIEAKQTNFLYNLIYKMNGSEKRYFKIASQQHTIGKGNNYLKLFDLIIQHQKKGWSGEKSLKSDFVAKYGKLRFDLYKANLYKKLLSCLESFHKANNIEVNLRSILNQAHILLQKGLSHQALSILKKAKGICQEHEKWYLLLEIIEMQRHVLYSIQNPSLDNSEEESILGKALSVSSHRTVQSKLWKTYLKNGLPTDDKTINTYRKLRNDLEEITPKDANTTIEIDMIRLYCNQFISGMEGDILATYSYGSTLIKLMDDNPIYMADKAELNIRCLINLQYAQIRLNKVEEVKRNRLKCRSIFEKFALAPSFQFAINTSLYVNEYDMAFKNGHLESLEHIIQSFDNYFSTNKFYTNPSTSLLYYWQKSIHHFVLEYYQESLDYNYNIINQKLPFRFDIQSLARIMNLIIYFELGEERLLNSFVVNTYRYLKRRERLLPIELFLIGFVKKVLTKNTLLIDRKKLFKSFKAQLTNLKGGDDSHESLLLMYIEYWLNKKQ